MVYWIIPMKRFPCTLYVALLLSFFLAGCKPHNQSDAVRMLADASSAQLGDSRHQKEDFDRSLELINSLDDSPSLPNTPGYEKLVGIADRLNKWIRNQKPDDTWKPDAAFLEVERAAMSAAETAKKIVRTLALLKGETVLDDHGQPIAVSETLQAERQAIIADLEQFGQQTQMLASLTNLPIMNRISQSVSDLKNTFTALENIPNLTADSIRSFAKQRARETEGFVSLAVVFENYATQLTTEGLFISTSDIEYLKQSAWMRDLSLWTCGDKRVLLEQAVQMCDWVVCNIEMRSNWIPINQQESIEVVPQHPWQTILLGYGTAQDRMFVFLELLRQRRIDAALLAIPHPKNPNAPYYWGVGVLLDDEIYVFQLEYGFPIPGVEGAKVGDDGSLQFSSVATLSQLKQDDSLLRRLDLSEEQKFPITAEMLQQTTAHFFLTPESVSMRMKVLEAELSGEQNMVLYTNPHELRRRFAAAGIAVQECGKYPFRTTFEQRFNPEPTNEAMSVFLIQRPRLNLDDSATRRHYPLWSGRILYFRGAISGQENAITKYQNTRVPDKEIIEYRNDPTFRNTPIEGLRLQWVTIQASYWLGAALFEANSIGASKDSLMEIRQNRLNSWRTPTEYLLGRIAEREKRYGDARRHYGNTSLSLSGVGNAVRTKWLPEQ